MTRRKTIVFAFDGVLAKEYPGWHGPEHIGPPIKKWVEAAKRWHKAGHTLKLCTTRLNPHVTGHREQHHDVASGLALDAIKYRLRRWGILHCFSEITGYKPRGDIYLGDKAYNVGGLGGLEPRNVDDLLKS